MIDEASLYNATTIWIIMALLLFPLLLFVKQPYGRHLRKGWGPLIPNNLAWIIMELPSLFLFAYFFLSGKNINKPAAIIIFTFWMIHYFHRTLIFPFKLKTKGKKMPVLIVLFALFFNSMNATLNGLYLGHFSNIYEISWLLKPQFIIGLVIFLIGICINIYSDYTLIGLRKTATNGYKIPTNGVFRLISCPNHFGEILEWTGFAILAWNYPALSFATWTIVNLIPRSLDHHKWYHENFENYPKNRKAIIPYIL